MEFKYLCVVGADGFYRARAIVGFEQDETGEIVKRMQHAELNQGERLIDTARPDFKSYTGMQGFVRPRWDGQAWTEGATPEELAKWNEEHPAPPPMPPTEVEVLQEENRLLRAQITAESDRTDFIEDCIAEMAVQVYKVN